MPKERITDLAGTYDIHIGWQHSGTGDGYVQLGVETHDSRTVVDTLLAGAVPRADLDRLLGSGEAPAFTGLWGTLDRAGCNQLIRTIRRARDGAFGADA